MPQPSPGFPAPPITPAQIMNEITRERETRLDRIYAENARWMAKSKYFRDALTALTRLNPDSFSFTNATYIIENAYFEGKLPLESFMKAIALKATQVRQPLTGNTWVVKTTLHLIMAFNGSPMNYIGTSVAFLNPSILNQRTYVFPEVNIYSIEIRYLPCRSTSNRIRHHAFSSRIKSMGSIQERRIEELL